MGADARLRMMKANERLVFHVARRYAGRGLDIQVRAIGVRHTPCLSQVLLASVVWQASLMRPCFCCAPATIVRRGPAERADERLLQVWVYAVLL